jgi:selenocysteine lyase/cysteine desulfurase
MPHHVDKMQVDFLIAAGYKWLLCPYGFSILYVNDKWFNARPLEETWLARENAENFAGLVNYNDNYKVGARKFEMGEKGMPTILPGAITALSQISIWGIENISRTIGSINEELASFFLSCGLQPLNTINRVPHILGINLGKDNTNYVGSLKDKNIFISQRGNALRIAPHLHINQEDIENFKQEIVKLRV